MTLDPIELRRYNSPVPVGITQAFYYLLITDDPFKAAGRIFNWAVYDIGTLFGLGCDKGVLYDCKKDSKLMRVGVTLNGKLATEKCYQISPVDWIRFAESTKSIQSKPKTELYVMPWNEHYFRTIKGEFGEIFEYIMKNKRP